MTLNGNSAYTPGGRLNPPVEFWDQDYNGPIADVVDARGPTWGRGYEEATPSTPSARQLTTVTRPYGRWQRRRLTGETHTLPREGPSQAHTARQKGFGPTRPNARNAPALPWDAGAARAVQVTGQF